MNWLKCLIWGHTPKRLNGTFYIVCLRCNATLNLSTGRRV